MLTPPLVMPAPLSGHRPARRASLWRCDDRGGPGSTAPDRAAPWGPNMQTQAPHRQGHRFPPSGVRLQSPPHGERPAFNTQKLPGIQPCESMPAIDSAGQTQTPPRADTCFPRWTNGFSLEVEPVPWGNNQTRFVSEHRMPGVGTMSVHISFVDHRGLSIEVYRRLRRAISQGHSPTPPIPLPPTHELRSRHSMFSRTSVTVGLRPTRRQGSSSLSRIQAGTVREPARVARTSTYTGRKFRASSSLQPRALFEVHLLVNSDRRGPLDSDFRTRLPDTSKSPHPAWHRFVIHSMRTEPTQAPTDARQGGTTFWARNPQWHRSVRKASRTQLTMSPSQTAHGRRSMSRLVFFWRPVTGLPSSITATYRQGRLFKSLDVRIFWSAS